jgi:ABC-type branched-subunit amino acid transport system ATPase component
LLIVLLNKFHNWPEEHDRVFPHIALKRDLWDDYNFQTTFGAELFISEYHHIDLGQVKIGRRGMKAADPAMRDQLPEISPGLPANHFSLGQDGEYYEMLNSIEPDLRRDFAESMRDIPMLGLTAEEFDNEDVFRISLLRFSSALHAMDTAYQLFDGAPERKIDRFTFEATLEGASKSHVIDFDFRKDLGVPHRMNILVGANGVGKTQVLARLAVLLSGFEERGTEKARKALGQTFEVLGDLKPRPSVYRVIAVSFSAFDDFDIPSASQVGNVDYAYCGLRLTGGGIADKKVLQRRISSAVRSMNEEQKDMLRQVVEAIFPELSNVSLTSIKLYRRLSAGQRIVLNIVCDLLLRIGERSLILLDEPETHLHPALLTTLLSVVAALLDTYDSFAIVATHSPIAVQQVVAKRVHIIRRIADGIPAVGHPPSETFGANLTDITREVFDAAESDRDYRDALDELLKSHGGDADAVRRLFPNGLGTSADIYLDSRAKAVAAKRAEN